MEIIVNPARDSWPELLRRPSFDQNALEDSVGQILSQVRLGGDRALFECIAKFENRQTNELLVSRKLIDESALNISADIKSAVDQAASNIRSFHQAQIGPPSKIETMPGVVCWWKDLPIERVGLYIPGGTAPLISTVLMLGIPAMLAGCKEIVACTPPASDGQISAALLYAAKVAGITELYAVGGAHAVGALAYGTQSISKVDKIFGPGNQYVTCAKMLVNRNGVAIDMPAGPSEVAVVADSSAPAAWVALDLLAQAEHGFDSQVVLIAFEQSYVESVVREVSAQLELLPRANFARESLKSSKAIIVSGIEDALELVNYYAPEHLILALKNPTEPAGFVKNAGSVFLGYFSPESVGDYASGTNHVLPTNGFARSLSGVGVASFIKRTTFQQLSLAGLRNIADTVTTLAGVEGLDAHKQAVTIRLKDTL
jgi:histidinol dehydrogenase